jgi:hypothetical protein
MEIVECDTACEKRSPTLTGLAAFLPTDAYGRIEPVRNGVARMMTCLRWPAWRLLNKAHVTTYYFNVPTGGIPGTAGRLADYVVWRDGRSGACAW